MERVFRRIGSNMAAKTKSTENATLASIKAFVYEIRDHRVIQ